eukprot:6378922-Pyramimonas_sp.AAC.1
MNPPPVSVNGHPHARDGPHRHGYAGEQRSPPPPLPPSKTRRLPPERCGAGAGTGAVDSTADQSNAGSTDTGSAGIFSRRRVGAAVDSAGTLRGLCGDSAQNALAIDDWWRATGSTALAGPPDRDRD